MFEDRNDAAQKLSEKLLEYKNSKSTTVIGLPRGGVFIARVLSDVLSLPLRIIPVKKISAPDNPELAIGAVAQEGIAYWDRALIKELRLSQKQKKESFVTAFEECKARIVRFGVDTSPVKTKTCIVADDGVATGATACAASLVLKSWSIQNRILATPVIARDTLLLLSQGFYDKVIVLKTSLSFHSVSQFYKNFPQVTDSEVLAALTS